MKALSSLTVSHFLCVLAATGPVQDRLLRAAHEGRWSVRRLRKEVGGLDALGSSTGRPRVPAVLKTLQGPLSSNEAFEDLESLLAVDRDTAKGLLVICQRTRDAMLKIERLLSSANQVAQHARVLVVDADQTFAMRAKRELQKHVKSVWLANSYAQALQRIDRNVSCVAINVVLPDGSGFELSRVLRSRYPKLACVFTVATESSADYARLGSEDLVVPRTSGLRHLSIAVLKALPECESSATSTVAV